MGKVEKRPMETVRLNIELADNGIILRNPASPDEVTLALDGEARHRDGYGYYIDRSDIHKAIGLYIYSWLVDVAMPEHDDWVGTGAELTIHATLTGRPRE